MMGWARYVLGFVSVISLILWFAWRGGTSEAKSTVVESTLHDMEIRSQPMVATVVKDPQTGCEYWFDGSGIGMPRLDSRGLPRGCRDIQPTVEARIR
jgi:hypothetical protein